MRSGEFGEFEVTQEEVFDEYGDLVFEEEEEGIDVEKFRNLWKVLKKMKISLPLEQELQNVPLFVAFLKEALID